MRTKSLLIAACILTCNLFTINLKAQDDLKKMKREKLKKARQEVFENKWVVSYYGGTMAPIGVSFYTMFAEKPGLYLSFRGGSEKGEDYAKPYGLKGMVLNGGVTLPLYYPVAMYLAAGISDYNIVTPTKYGPDKDIIYPIGAETSAGLIFHIKKVKVQGGVSLVNFKYPDVTFGLGYSLF